MSTNRPTVALDVPAAKIAETTVPIHEIIASRWSPRSFSDRAVSSEDLRTVFEAARWAASSYNEQPWRFFVATKADPAAFEKLLGLLVEFNQGWVKTAPVLFIMAAKKTFSAQGSPNRFNLHDAGAALANLSLQATALGMHAHGMAGVDFERAKTELHLPDDFEVGAAAALGYRDDPDKLGEQYRKADLAKRERKILTEIVFGADWNAPAPLG